MAEHRALTCDCGCGASAVLTDSSDSPAGWYVLRRNRPFTLWHFSSASCLRVFTAREGSHLELIGKPT